MKDCPYCHAVIVKHGFLKKGNTQRYRCVKCLKTCSDADKRQYGTLRTNPAKVEIVINLLAEGSGIRSASRVVGIHRDTVLSILKFAGQRCERLLQSKLVNIPATHIEVDEVWTFVEKKQKGKLDPELDLTLTGDFYTFMGIESETKLVFMPFVGKRTETTTQKFMDSIRDSLAKRTQITSDGFPPYKTSVERSFGNNVDFCQFYKEFNMRKKAISNKLMGWQMNQGLKPFIVRSGSPDHSLITTNHIERENLNIRTWNKRFNRSTICFSKKAEFLKYSVLLFVSHYNFRHAHSSLGKKTTPAMAAGIESKPLSISEMVKWTSL